MNAKFHAVTSNLANEIFRNFTYVSTILVKFDFYFLRLHERFSKVLLPMIYYIFSP